ncbi:MAG TPA: hypothetical protein EYQ83_14060 [Acidobacteria bacterium]|nr:hypothetical protein [Acidobacteriota bacterium]
MFSLSRLARLTPRRLLHSLDEADALRAEVDRLRPRVRQLVAAHETTEKTTVRLRDALATFDPIPTAEHVAAAVAAARLEEDPFPHLVIDSLLPPESYDRLVKTIPPALFFEHLARNHQELMVPSDLAPLVSREVWAAFYSRAVSQALAPALVAAFQRPLNALVHRHWPAYDSMAEAGITLDVLMSRILRRQPGYVIKPHRDPRWAFLTCLVYLPSRKTTELFGTELCRVHREREADSHGALWIKDADVEVVKTVAGQPNTAVAFVNTTGAHQAAVPSTVDPDTVRHLYQLQLGPPGVTQRRLLKQMPAADAARWRRQDKDPQ